MKKFTNNDIFYNELLTNPRYVVVMQSGSLRINDQIEQNQEHSSSLLGLDKSGTYIFEGPNKIIYTGSYQYTSSIGREFVYATSSIGSTYPNLKTFDDSYTNYSTIKKIFALKNNFKNYISENLYSDLKYYFCTNSSGKYLPENILLPSQKKITIPSLYYPPYFLIPTSSINYLEIPAAFYGSYIKPGSIQLNMYISGVLTASAIDTNKDGIIYQTSGGTIGNPIGSVFYEEGIILLTGSQNLSSQQAPYIQPLSQFTSSYPPINDYLKWIYFGSYISSTSSAPETKYELIFQGTNYIPTLTMMCHAEKNEFYWSNNRTFIEAGQGEEIFVGQSTSSLDKTGSYYYADPGSFLLPSDGAFKEVPITVIKNTISSSFTHYSASYEPQVFISQIGIYDDDKNLIGIAKLANPVRKTKELDYTFKLKLDF